MKLLLVAPDPNLTRLLSTMLSSAGHSVSTAAEARTALVQAAASMPDALVIDARLPDTTGLALLRQIRRREGGARPRAVLFADDPAAQPAAELAELGVDHVLGRPPSLLDLADILAGLHVGGPRRDGPAQSPRAPPPKMLNLGNVARLGGWWSQRATGVVRLDMDGGTTRWVTLVNGGPVDAEGRERLVEALGGGSVELDPCDIDGEGDPATFGREIWAVVRPWVASRIRPTANLVVTPTAGITALGDLPLPASVRRVLMALNRPTSLDTLRESTGAGAEELVGDITALALLSVVFTHAARAAAAPSAAEPASQPTVTRSTPVTAPRVDRPFAAEAHATAPVVRDPPSYARAPRADGPTDGHVDPPTRPNVTDPGLVAREVLRLRKEAKLVTQADPWTVLALPRGTSLDIVSRSVDRMEARYLPLMTSPHGEIRDAASRIIAAIRGAFSDIQRSGAGHGPSEEMLIAAGRVLIDRGDWTGADRRFSAARDLSPDSPRALAWLGYARFHNPAFEAEARQEEGVALLDLALAYDDRCTDAQYLRAVVAEADHDLTTARVHLGRVLDLAPTHEGARALFGRLPRGQD